MLEPYDAFLLVSFGGPEKQADVIPFLENVLRGRNVPRERMLEVAEHYDHFGGKSPINDQNRALLVAVEQEFQARGIKLPVYFGNRNWHPLLPDTLRQMKADGVRRAIAFFTSAFSSYSGCRQYRENIAAAQAEVGEGAPMVDRLRMFFNHPGYIEPMIENTAAALAQIPPERRERAAILFTAHSIPQSMAATCQYETQLREACRLVAEGANTSRPHRPPRSLGRSRGIRMMDCGPRSGRNEWRLVYQSRSGPPNQPWLEPDVRVALQEIAQAGGKDAVVVPIGFISDHLEVLYDLDEEAQVQARQLGLNMVRAATVGTHPRFVRMIRELVQERLVNNPSRLWLGNLGPSHDICPVDCCAYQPRRP